jgi:hypothetical protein
MDACFDMPFSEMSPMARKAPTGKAREAATRMILALEGGEGG